VPTIEVTPWHAHTCLQSRLAEGLTAALAARSTSAVGHALHAYSSIGDAEGAQVRLRKPWHLCWVSHIQHSCTVAHSLCCRPKRSTVCFGVSWTSWCVQAVVRRSLAAPLVAAALQGGQGGGARTGPDLLSKVRKDDSGVEARLYSLQASFICQTGCPPAGRARV
jgi:hypothetical protein